MSALHYTPLSPRQVVDRQLAKVSGLAMLSPTYLERLAQVCADVIAEGTEEGTAPADLDGIDERAQAALVEAGFGQTLSEDALLGFAVYTRWAAVTYNTRLLELAAQAAS